jgi:chromosome segregation ATPase
VPEAMTFCNALR